MDAADSVPMAVTPPSKSVSITETTLSFAMNPLISDVIMRQSPSPAGFMTGTSRPAAAARMLSCESLTGFSPKSKLLRNHTTIVAIRMIENARDRKSFVFSQRSYTTSRGHGRR